MNQSVVKIMAGEQGEIFVGVGLLATDRSVITCAHVMRNRKAPFTISLPLSETPQKNYRWDCTILQSSDFEDDLALLISDDPIILIGAQPARFLRNDEVKGNQFSAFGYPVGIDGGTTATGEITSNQGYGWREIKGNIGDDTGYFIQKGFSGGGVYNTTQNAFTGIVNVAYSQVRRFGCYIPIENFVAMWPEQLSSIFWIQGARRSRVMELDEAFICGRDELQESFVDLYDRCGGDVQHYFTAGRSVYSPFGVCRKIIYEKFTHKTDAQYTYITKPNRSSNDTERLIINGSTRMNDLLEQLFFHAKRSPGQLIDNQSIATMLASFIDQLALNVPNYIPIYVECPVAKARLESVITLVNEFAKSFNAACQGKKVLFFWAFAYEPHVKALLRSPTKLIKRYLDSALFGQGFINDRRKVTHPTESKIEEWIRKVRKAGAAFLRKEDVDEANLKAETYTVNLEARFIEIITIYNDKNDRVLR